MAEVGSKGEERIRYRRVRGLRRFGTLSHSALFTAEDHLLLCDYRTGFTERYKRFYFGDIEAVIIRKTPHWIVGMLIWGLLASVFLLIALGTRWNRFLEVMEAICLLGFLRNLILGPSCRTHIQTAVQTDALPMLRRVRKTKRVLGSLFPLIEQSQGGRENVSAPAKMSILRDSPATSLISPPSRRIHLAEAESPPRAHDLSLLHVATFALVLLLGLSALWEVNYPATWSFTTVVTLFCLSAICGVIALVLQGKYRVHQGAAIMTWLLVVSFVIGGGGIEYGFTMASFVARARPRLRPTQTAPVTFDFVTPFQMRSMPGFAAVLWFYGVWSVLVGLLGLVFALMPPPAKALPPPLPGEQRA